MGVKVSILHDFSTGCRGYFLCVDLLQFSRDNAWFGELYLIHSKLLEIGPLAEAGSPPSNMCRIIDLHDLRPRYDIIVAMDEGIRQQLLAAAPVESGGDISWYSDRVCCVSTFRHYCGDEILAGVPFTSFLAIELNLF